ncbi:hypothetical protein DD99_23915 [Salmonella enterica subsp. enterica serovar Saintpaul]|nr:hypothetical protein DD99_23915 [Salmonella enterica subsp. enterica serovar Saintpaul]
MVGLSPLARGTHQYPAFWFFPRRFIPAGAGNTVKNNTAHVLKAVYPRWRGEHGDMGTWTFSRCGLSPLARGTQVVAHLMAIERRFIPAGAGNTRLRFFPTQ